MCSYKSGKSRIWFWWPLWTTWRERVCVLNSFLFIENPLYTWIFTDLSLNSPQWPLLGEFYPCRLQEAYIIYLNLRREDKEILHNLFKLSPVCLVQTSNPSSWKQGPPGDSRSWWVRGQFFGSLHSLLVGLSCDPVPHLFPFRSYLKDLIVILTTHVSKAK